MTGNPKENNTKQPAGKEKPTVIDGRYRLDKIIGEGSYSIVFRGYDLDKRRKVAVKELKSQGMTREDAEEAHQLFFNEINVLKKLNHPNIPKVYDFIIFEDRHYMVMQWINGKSLLTILEEGKRLSESEALFYMEQVTSVLNYLQTKGGNIVYKDLKPSNLLVANNGHIWLIDFGTARFYSPKKKKDTHVLGTPGYAPPEAYTETQTDLSADIYSLGATFYHLTTGQEPFQFKFKFPDPRQFRNELTEKFSHLLLNCLKPRDKRISNALELNSSVRQVIMQKGINPYNRILTTFCTLTLILYFFYYLFSSGFACCGLFVWIILFQALVIILQKVFLRKKDVYSRRMQILDHIIFAGFSSVSILIYSHFLTHTYSYNPSLFDIVPMVIFPLFILYRIFGFLYDYFKLKINRLYIFLFALAAFSLIIELLLETSVILLIFSMFTGKSC